MNGQTGTKATETIGDEKRLGSVELKNERKWPEVQRKPGQRGRTTSGPPLKMFTGLLRVKWVANAVTSMQTTSKHNSLIQCIAQGAFHVATRLSPSRLPDQIM